LESQNVRDIFTALITFPEIAQILNLDLPLVDRLYHAVIPHLTHSQYKIRSHSFKCAFAFLRKLLDVSHCDKDLTRGITSFAQWSGF
jgi:hypothetical protein